MDALVDQLLRRTTIGDGCWEWCGRINRHGYGQVSIKHRTVAVHRLSYRLFAGDIPDGLCVLHKCDNPACVRPSHLFLGTHAENVADRDAKGRTARGRRIPNSKLSAGDVLEIRRRCVSGDRQSDIARDYGIAVSQVSQIHTRKVWRWVGAEAAS